VSVDVSVVIPFFNPGADIEECLASMVSQTLEPARFEVIVVDDGSTDGSADRVDEWVRRHPGLIFLFRIEASGGPARPRNVGVAHSRGRYVQFVDADDTLAPQALERLVDIADESEADIVVHKISSGGPRNVYHRLFRRTVTGLTFADFPELVRNGTVCKLFRRSFLLDHEVTFPEGDTYIEDQFLCLRTYANARSIALFSDMVCYYHWRRRTGGVHFGDAEVEPGSYRAEVAAVLDIVASEVTSHAARVVAARRYYRGEVLGRLRRRAMLGYEPEYRSRLTAELRELASTRFTPEVRDGLPALLRVQSELLLAGDVDGLLAYGEQLDRLRLQVTASKPRWRDGRLVCRVDALVRSGDVDLRLESDGTGWAFPEWLAPGSDPAARRWSAADDQDLDLDVAAVSRVDSSLWSTTDGLQMTVESDGTPRFHGEVEIDPQTLAGGSALHPGVWDFRFRLGFSGLARSAAIAAATDAVEGPISCWVAEEGSATVFWTRRTRQLALDVGERMYALHDLVDEPSERTVVAATGELVMAAPRLLGDDGQVRAAAVIVAPEWGGADRGRAEVRLGATGSAVHCSLPTVDPEAGYGVWLRTGELGGGPARRLDVTVAADGG
jgi:glycosyltransferase involved in cell wall biosynthesis